MGNVIMTIMQGSNLLLQLAPVAIGLAASIKRDLSLGSSDLTVNITTLAGTAIAEDDATLADINSWRSTNGFPPIS